MMDSLKQLEEAIKNFPTCEQCVVFTKHKHAQHRALMCEGMRACGKCPMELHFEEIKKEFDAFKADNVIVPRKQLEDRISTLSEAIHDELMKHDVKLRPYAKLVDGVVWDWFRKEVLEK